MNSETANAGRGRRLRIITISPELLFEIFRTGEHPPLSYAVENGVPVDAELVNVQHGFNTNCVEIMIRSSEFAPLRDGDVIERLEPICTRKAATLRENLEFVLRRVEQWAPEAKLGPSDCWGGLALWIRSALGEGSIAEPPSSGAARPQEPDGSHQGNEPQAVQKK